MNPAYEKLMASYYFLRRQTDFVPSVALVLGSGLGGFADRIRVEKMIDCKIMPSFPAPAVDGHDGKLILGYVGEVPVAAMKGRVHYYEGYSMPDVVMPARLMGILGAKTLILTNAAGSVNPDFRPGELMLIKGQISSFVPSPLIGENIEELGTRFPDMSEIYHTGLRGMIRETARECGITLREGVYLQAPGPNYESPEEVRMYRTFGADAIGMSTACEAIAARHMGMRVCGISCLTNMAAGICEGTLSHEDVKKVADAVASDFQALIERIILKMGA